MFLRLLHNGAGSDFMDGDAFLGFYCWRNSQYDRVSPSFFADRRLDGLLYPVLAGIVGGRYCECSSWLVAALLLCDSLLGEVYPRWYYY
jgi:hypothetical protein